MTEFQTSLHPINHTQRQLVSDIAWMTIQAETHPRAILANVDRAWDLLMPLDRVEEAITLLVAGIRQHDEATIRKAVGDLAQSDIVIGWYLRWLDDPQPLGTHERCVSFQLWAGLTVLQDASVRAPFVADRTTRVVLKLAHAIAQAPSALALQPVIALLDIRITNLARAVARAFTNQQEKES